MKDLTSLTGYEKGFCILCTKQNFIWSLKLFLQAKSPLVWKPYTFRLPFASLVLWGARPDGGISNNSEQEFGGCHQKCELLFLIQSHAQNIIQLSSRFPRKNNFNTIRLRASLLLSSKMPKNGTSPKCVTK